jgi:hypothetical protein
MNTVIVFLAGLVAGAMNAAAGGGSFVSVPTLIYVGVPSVTANMSSTIALYPGSLASAWAYRKNFGPILNVSVRSLFFVTLLGGFAGALLLLLTPTTSFDKILPWLLTRFVGVRLRWKDWRAFGGAVSAKEPLYLSGAVHPGRVWRVFRRRGGHHDAGDVECAGPARHSRNECHQGGIGGRSKHHCRVVFRRGRYSGLASDRYYVDRGRRWRLPRCALSAALASIAHSNRDQYFEFRDHWRVFLFSAFLKLSTSPRRTNAL